MDNLAHTLAGAALAKAGLERRTPLALPTLLVAANLPDIDVLAYLRDPLLALTFRRGWTHGVLAMVVFPLVLAGVMVRDRMVRLRRHPDARPAPFRELLLVSAIGLLSHPFLDLLNTYGVRLLMPFSGRWFYGDALFIVDPWLSGLFAMAWLARWGGRGRERAGEGGSGAVRRAQVVVGVALLYMAGMWTLGQVAASAAAREALAVGIRPARIMASPVPVHLLRRSVLFDLDGRYRWGRLDWRRAGSGWVLDPDVIRRGFDEPRVARALEHPHARAFLRWSRFPAAATTAGSVRLYDLRYASADVDSWASVVIPDSASSAREEANTGSLR